MTGEEQQQPSQPPPPPPPPPPSSAPPDTLASQPEPYPQPSPAPPSRRQFDPSRMIGIIRRKSLIKELAAVYHAECLSYCQELLELQKKWEESLAETKTPEDPRKETVRPLKRAKKSR